MTKQASQWKQRWQMVGPMGGCKPNSSKPPIRRAKFSNSSRIYMKTKAMRSCHVSKLGQHCQKNTHFISSTWVSANPTPPMSYSGPKQLIWPFLLVIPKQPNHPPTCLVHCPVTPTICVLHFSLGLSAAGFTTPLH